MSARSRLGGLARSPWARRGAAGVVAVAIVGGGCWVYAAHAGGPSGYRTAVATDANVTQTLALSGTVKPLGRSDLQFATSGTVSSVVAVGATVKKGQVVATLKRAALHQTVIEDEARLASAQAKLASDTTTQADQAAASASAAAASASAAAAASKQAGQSAGSQADPVAAAQKACVSSSATSSGGSTGSGGTTGSGGSSSGAPSGGSGTKTTTKSPTKTTGTSTTKTGGTLTCAQALAQVEAYIKSLDAQVKSAQSSASKATTGSGGSSFSGGGTVTAATLASDQADIDTANASLIAAKEQLAGAVLRAPAAGTVAQVDVTQGGTASSGSVALTILGKGITTVTLSVTSTQVAQLKVGQAASVLPASGTTAFAGTVTQVSPVPVSSGSGTSSTSAYPVTVTLAREDLSLLAGEAAAVTVTVGSATNTLTVPTSAVVADRVTVLKDGATSSVRVTTGVVGPSRTQIVSGISLGEVVVLADLSEALPTSGSSQTTTRFGGTGGFGGTGTTGFGGAGLTGGGGTFVSGG